MATFNKVLSFGYNLAVSKQMDLNADTLRVVLVASANVPVASTTNDLADITQIATGNGYVTSGKDIGNSASRAAATGVTSIRTTTGVIWTATGGSIGPFRHVVLYDTTSTSNLVIGWWDYGSNVTLSAAESFTVDFGTSVLTIT